MAFSTTTYQARRQRLARGVTSGLILLMGNADSPVNNRANCYPFRQDSSFLYFFGLDRPDLAGVMDIDEGRETVFGDDPSLDDIIWLGGGPSLADSAARVGCGATAPLADLAGVLDRAAVKGRKIHILPPYRDQRILTLSRLTGRPPEGVGELVSPELIRAVVALREIKDDQEIEQLDRAAGITRRMMLRAMALTRPGRTERGIGAELEAVALTGGGGLSMHSIVTVNGQILHNTDRTHTLEDGRLLLIDTGAESLGRYAGDLTRTFPVNGRFSSRQREIYNAVLAVNKAAIGLLEPGKSFRDIHLAACRILAAGLKDLGLMKGDTEAAVAAGAHALFMPHGLGHQLGLDAHDMEDLGEDYVGYGDQAVRSGQFGLSALRMAKRLDPGMAVTIEPGCYFVPELIRRWSAEKRLAEFIDYSVVRGFLDFGGIRIEDDVLITTQGARLLGEPLIKEAGEVEAAIGG